jgi:hypothetical protein
MSYLREDTCRRGVPLRRLWTAAEVLTVKSFINNLNVRFWNLPYTQVDSDNAVIYLPRSQAVGGGGRWTGVVFFGNEITQDYSDNENWPDNVDGELVVVNLRDGTPRYADWDDEDWDDAEEQIFWVADKVEDEAEPPNVSYRLNRHTQGDIHARIT